MSKKSTKKRSPRHGQEPKAPSGKEENVLPAGQQKPDYGGLPDIDLKKNLGCG